MSSMLKSDGCYHYTLVAPSSECYEVKAGAVSLQCYNCVIHIPERFTGELLTMLYKSSFLLPLPFYPMTPDLINKQIRLMSPLVHFPCRGDQHYGIVYLLACSFRI